MHSASELPETLFEALSDVQVIFHLGDITDISVLYELEPLCDVYAVAGNMDTYGVKAQLPDSRLVTIEGVRIAITHGSGAPSGLPERVFEKLKIKNPNVMLFGHSHNPYKEDRDGVLLFNPGSLRDGNLGIMELSRGKVLSAEHISI